jgi:3-isopropylmalate/(R)-2-methylmalate dehydratase large subunit
MGHTFAEKALARNAGLPSLQSGQVIDVHPDVVLSHDNTAAIVRTWRQLGLDRVKYPERLAIVLDHASPAPTTQHAQNHAQIRRFVAQQGIRHFFDVGRGICHQVLCEEGLVRPGTVVLGGDSHTTHHGALGAFGAAIGRSEVAAIWATGHIWMRVPDSVKITVQGTMVEWVSAKDLALHIIGTLGADAGNYASVEFHGPTIAVLSMESRFVLTNMAAEMGVKNAWIAPDQVTLDWLKSQETSEVSQTSEVWSHPDPDATYLTEHTFDASTMEPMVACPHTVDNVLPVSQVVGIPVQQALVAGDPGFSPGTARRRALGVHRNPAGGRSHPGHTRMWALHGQPHGRAGIRRSNHQHRQPQLPGANGHPGVRDLSGQPGRGGRQRGRWEDHPPGRSLIFRDLGIIRWTLFIRGVCIPRCKCGHEIRHLGMPCSTGYGGIGEMDKVQIRR